MGINSNIYNELFFCLTGKIKVNIDGDDIVLSKGDAVVFRREDPHKYVNVREDNLKKTSVGLSVMFGSGYTSVKELHKNLQIVSKKIISLLNFQAKVGDFS